MFELIVNRRCNTGQLAFIDAGGQRVTELAVDPVKDIDRAFLGKAETGVRWPRRA